MSREQYANGRRVQEIGNSVGVTLPMNYLKERGLVDPETGEVVKTVEADLEVDHDENEVVYSFDPDELPETGDRDAVGD